MSEGQKGIRATFSIIPPLGALGIAQKVLIFFLPLFLVAGLESCSRGKGNPAGGSGASGSSIVWIQTAVPGPSSDASVDLGDIFISVGLDSADNSYVLGIALGPIVYNLGNNVVLQTNGKGKAAFLVKYRSDGTALWVHSFESEGDVEFHAIVVDARGNCYLAGYAAGIKTLELGNGIAADLDGLSSRSALIAKVDADGKAVWAKTVKTSDSTNAKAPNGSEFELISIDPSGNRLLLTGSVYGYGSRTFVFGDGTSFHSSETGRQAVLAGYDIDGTIAWVRSLTDVASPLALEQDGQGNIFVAGSVEGGNDIDFGDDVQLSSSPGIKLPLLVKFDSSGKAVWARRPTAVSTGGYKEISSQFHALTLDATGNCYVAGDLSESGNFDLGNGIPLKTPYDGSYPVLAEYDSGGSELWAATVDSMYVEFQTLSHDAGGNLIVGTDLIGDDVTVTADFGQGRRIVQANTEEIQGLVATYSRDGKPVGISRQPNDSKTGMALPVFGIDALSPAANGGAVLMVGSIETFIGTKWKKQPFIMKMISS